MTNLNGDDPRSMLRSQRAIVANAGVPDIPPSDVETARALLREGIPDWCARTLAGVRKDPPDRTAMNNYARAMNLIGADVELNVNLILTRELGVSLSEARRKLAMVASIEGIGDDEAITAMEVAVREFYHDRGFRLLIVKDEPLELAAP